MGDRDGQGDSPDAGSGADPAEGLTISVDDRRWRELFEIDQRIAAERGVRLLTPEARVLIFLMSSGPAPVSTAMQVAGVSYRGFYDVLERLKQAGLVESARDPQDQRVRRLMLDPNLINPSDDR